MDDLELEVTEPAPEDAVPTDDGAGETVPADETETTDSDEAPETNPEESGSEEEPEETEPSDKTESSGSENQPEDSEPEDLTGEQPADDAGETVSGNDIIAISGNAVIFPEDFDLSLLGSGSESAVDQTALIEAIENQSTLLYNVSAAVIFLLGVIAGILLIHGFRLRRT